MVEERIRAIRPNNPRVSVEVTGGIRIAPLERTPRNTRLWEQARERGREMGLDLEEAMAGGGSDGNTTSLFTATLDGLGCVGDIVGCQVVQQAWMGRTISLLPKVAGRLHQPSSEML